MKANDIFGAGGTAKDHINHPNPCPFCERVDVKFDGWGSTKRISCANCDIGFDVRYYGADWHQYAITLWNGAYTQGRRVGGEATATKPEVSNQQPQFEGGQGGGECAPAKVSELTENKLTPHPQAHILRAIADGKKVRYRRPNRSPVWYNFSPEFQDISFNPTLFEWQIAPEEPRVETGSFMHGDDINDLRDVSYKLTIDPVTDRVISLELVK